jgi:hypothetical protein
VVADLYEKAGLVAPPVFFGFFAESADGTHLPYPKEAGIYLLYVPPLPAEQK